MAQYFRPIIFSDKTPIVYEYRIGGKLEPRTLTERSWWNSPVLSTVCERIVNNPKRIVWIGSCPNYDNNITPPKAKNKLFSVVNLFILVNIFFLFLESTT